MSGRVAVLAGDGIGPEVTAAAVRVLQAAVPEVVCEPAAVGGAAIAAEGVPLPERTLAVAAASDAILLGAVGGPGFDGLPPERRPEAALLALRRHFGLFANLRPVQAFAGLEARSPLRAERVSGMDCVIVRELTGGLYFGPRAIVTGDDGVVTATDTLVYTDREIARIARVAFRLARERRRRVTSVDKANVLASSVLWRRVVNAIAAEFPDVALEHVLVDNAAMQFVRDPRAYDVVLTENAFGDILSDEAAMIAGTIGTAPSASLGERDPGGRSFGLYEPISGTAPDIAGRDVANPVGAILSAALLARYSLGNDVAARRIEAAVAAHLADGPRTADLDEHPVGTAAFARAIEARVRRTAVA